MYSSITQKVLVILILILIVFSLLYSYNVSRSSTTPVNVIEIVPPEFMTKNESSSLTSTTTTTTTTTLSNKTKTNTTQKQQQHNKEGPNKNKKLFFAIHIGPSKTGSSTIQKESAYYQDFQQSLQNDNVIYVGRMGHQLKKLDSYSIKRTVANTNNNTNGILSTTISTTHKQEWRAYVDAMKCMSNILKNWRLSRKDTGAGEEDIRNMNWREDDIKNINYHIVNNESIRADLRQTFLEKCWMDDKNGKNVRYILDSSLVDSNEAYSRPSSGIKLKDIIQIVDILGYAQIIVIGAYRRYAAWLVSTYTQHTKKTCLEKQRSKNRERLCPHISSYIEKSIQKKKKKDFTARHGFYHNLDITLSLLGHQPKKMLGLPPSSKLETKILNFFQLPKDEIKSITTELYCDALDMGKLTPNACTFCRERDRRSSSNTSYNYTSGTTKKDENDSDDNDNNDNISNYSSSNSSNSGYYKTSQPAEAVNKGSLDDVMYQHIIATAYKLGLLPVVDSSSITTWQELKLYHQNSTLGHNLRLNSIQNLPLLCPTKKKLDVLLKKSLAFEKLIMPEFYVTPLGKEEHVRYFWDILVEQKKAYCEVDTNRLFENVTSWYSLMNERMVTYKW